MEKAKEAEEEAKEEEEEERVSIITSAHPLPQWYHLPESGSQ